MLGRSLVAVVALTVHAFAQSPQWTLSPIAYPLMAVGAEYTVAVGDVNLDGRADVIAMSSGPAAASRVLLGQVTGGLQDLSGTPLGTWTGYVLAVADVDSDSLPDVLLDNVVLKGHGDGTFGPAVSGPAFVYTGGGLNSVVLADVNNDGLTDIASALSVGFTGELRVGLGKPGGGYYLPFSWVLGGTGSRVFSGDATGDGITDFVCSSSTGFAIVSRSATGSVTFQSYARGGVRVVAELTGDQWPDLYGPYNPIVIGQGNGLFSQGPTIPIMNPPVIAFNGDGLGTKELAGIANVPTGTAVVIARSVGGGAFDTSCQVPMPAGVSYLASADVLNDARSELIALCGSSPNQVLRILLNVVPDCDHDGIDDPVEVAQGLTSDCDANGVPDSCQADCDGSGQADVCQIAAQPSLDLNQNGALDSCETVGTPYCFGDGSGAACPCDPGQAGPIGGGCKNSIGSGGRLRAVGNAQVTLDSVTITASGVDTVAPGLLFQGPTMQASGLGSSFGDGLLCVSGTVIRLLSRSAAGGVINYGRAFPNDPALSLAGAVPAGGATVFYQVWYRDNPVFCTTAAYNMTNGVGIAWQP